MSNYRESITHLSIDSKILKIYFQDRSSYYDLKSSRDKITLEKEIGGPPNIKFNKYEYTMNNGHLKLLNYKPLKPEKV